MDIKVALGWGLDNVDTCKGVIVDKRFLVTDLLDDYEKNIKGFRSWVCTKDGRYKAKEATLRIVHNSHSIDTFFMDSDAHKDDPKELKICKRPPFVYDFILGSSSTVVFLPLETRFQGWLRCDDMTDYNNYVRQDQHEEPIVRKIEGHIPGFDYYHRINIPIPRQLLHIQHMLPDMVSSAAFEDMVKIRPVMKDSFHEYYRILPAESILLYTLYTKMFANWEKTVLELKPMMYVYWR